MDPPIGNHLSKSTSQTSLSLIFSMCGPTIAPNEQVNILDLLCRYVTTTGNLRRNFSRRSKLGFWAMICNPGDTLTSRDHGSLLSPIGNHRREHIEPSKGKRHRKRTHAEGNKRQLRSEINPSTKSDPLRPPHPPIQKFLTIGFNSTNRHLESLVRTPVNDKEAETVRQERPWMSAVFVPCFDQPSVLNRHLPLLVRMASCTSPSKPPIRLVSLPKGAESKLSTSLGIPRAGLVGLLDGSTGAEGLIELVRRLVPVVEIPWLQDVTIGTYVPVNIKAIETSAPVSQKRKRPIGPRQEAKK